MPVAGASVVKAEEDLTRETPSSRAEYAPPGAMSIDTRLLGGRLKLNLAGASSWAISHVVSIFSALLPTGAALGICVVAHAASDVMLWMCFVTLWPLLAVTLGVSIYLQIREHRRADLLVESTRMMQDVVVDAVPPERPAASGVEGRSRRSAADGGGNGGGDRSGGGVRPAGAQVNGSERVGSERGGLERDGERGGDAGRGGRAEQGGGAARNGGARRNGGERAGQQRASPVPEARRRRDVPDPGDAGRAGGAPAAEGRGQVRSAGRTGRGVRG